MSRRYPRRPLTEVEHAARRQADRDRLEQAARALLTSDGWQRWIKVRATNGLSRYSLLKLDERVVKIIATLNLGGELDQLAMRGARYGFPGWVEQTQTKGGTPKAVYIERRADAGAKAREYLSLAKAGQEAAGRLLALVAIARYADEGAVAQSSQSYYHLPVPTGLPWSGEIVDLIDQLASERLPDHLTATKRAERAEQRQKEAERDAFRRSIAERIARGSELDAEERSQLREEIEQTIGRYSPQAHDLVEQLDELEREATEAAHGDVEGEAREVVDGQAQ
jgi:hypothetical protein